MLRFISKQQLYLKSFLAIKDLAFLKRNQNIYFEKSSEKYHTENSP